mmetsp:Transcript_115656/g.258446  ORF Transcript_115656/g.258446 Transcript_115656/m.258446 type:complete len:373 (+) Transcript_115656:76-1194(+)
MRATLAPKAHAGSWHAAVLHDWRALELAPPEIYADAATVLAVLERAGHPEVLRHAAPHLLEDKAFCIDAMRVSQGAALRFAAEAMRADRDVVAEAVRQDPLQLRHASASLRTDGLLVRDAMASLREQQQRPGGGGAGAAAAQHGDVRGAAEALGAPAKVVCEASFALDPERWRSKVRRDWAQLAHAPAPVRADRELVFEAVRESWGAALRFASADLQGEREIVLEAVQYDGLTLQFAAEALRSDLEVVLEAVRQNWRALEYASEALRGDHKVASEALLQSPEAFGLLSEGEGSVCSDRAFVLEVLRRDGLALRYVAEPLRTDPELVAAAARQNPMALQFAPEALRLEVANASIQSYMRRATPCPAPSPVVAQ